MTKHNKLGFPIIDCARCDGEGKIVKYGHVDAGRCFDCQGTGHVLTAEGSKAFAAYLAALEAAPKKLAADFEAGDRVQVGKTYGTIASVEVKGTNIKFGFANSRCDFFARFDMALRTDDGIDVADFTKGL
ncbi:DnaJ-like chaperonin [Arthrobacter phage Abba]|uniref:DnaJ-like chaperonin n=1 Tax=Arthrobacter phage Abba TaxID=2713256 RepID=A0A6G8R2I8_9CAUD|nr:DnaJ-like chaperonin [Arthrobacter phage Abba]QIN94381.1 DnaJ-like chaperonin [Arthrobacter phage Abba]